MTAQERGDPLDGDERDDPGEARKPREPGHGDGDDPPGRPPGAGTGGERPGEEPRPGTQGGGRRGLFGCLGCAGAVVLLLVVLPVLLIGGAWLLLPTLAAPADTEWEMVAPDPDRSERILNEVRTSVAALDQEGHATIRLTEEELNVLVAHAIEARGLHQPDAEGPPKVRVRIQDERVLLDMVTRIPQDAAGVPARLRGETTGLELVMRPRVEANILALAIDGARLGRVPMPVNLALTVVRATPIGRELAFLDPETGELRIPLHLMADIARYATVESLRATEGSLILELSR